MRSQTFGGEARRTGFALVLAALVAAVGCAMHRVLGAKSLRLRVGMSRQQARAVAGAPQEVVAQQQQGVMIEAWKYLDGTLVFHQGMLSSWKLQPPPEQPSP